jgi:hypothetical protein
MEITLPPDIERALTEQASKQGTTPELLALDSLRERFLDVREQAAPPGEYTTLAEFLMGHIGVLHSNEQVSGGARMSEDSGRHFAEGLLRKRQQGHL